MSEEHTPAVAIDVEAMAAVNLALWTQLLTNTENGLAHVAAVRANFDTTFASNSVFSQEGGPGRYRAAVDHFLDQLAKGIVASR